MNIYHKLGKLPKKRHVTFYKPNGKDLYREELVSSKGFSDIYSLKYHINMPTQYKSVKEIGGLEKDDWNEAPLQHYHFYTDKKQNQGDFLTSRNCFLKNQHCRISTAHPTKNSEYFYKNVYHSEFIFIHHGKGNFVSEYGQFRFEEGDQIIIPQSTIYQLEFDKNEGNKILIIESDTAYEFPDHYINKYGQTEEHAPFYERDFKLPEYLDPKDENGEYRLIAKADEKFYEYILPKHPYDVVGWDGYLYPFAFNIKDYAPKVGKLHLPPPVHLLFNTQHFVICNFCPRLFDWHEGAVPAPYFHSNIDSAEVLYYVEGDFMSRKGVGEGSITLHPMGLPHGPQPGKTEASVGAKETEEYAIMIDTFAPLHPTKNVKETIDDKYHLSWLED